MRYLIGIFILALLFPWTPASAEGTYRRHVSFEWDAIEGARLYDVELVLQKTEDHPQKKFAFKSKDAAWSGRLAPGKYIMRLRARDYRGVPGDWSEPSDFNVGLEPAQLKSPVNKANFNSHEDSEVEVPFVWQPVEGATHYHFEISSDDGTFKKSLDLDEPRVKLSIPVARHYNWKVSASNDEHIQSDAAALAEFNVLGKRLDSPRITAPESGFVRELKWQAADNAAAYDVYLMKLNKTARKWEKFKFFPDQKNTTISFDPAWSGGKYQLVVRAKAPLRASSPLAKNTFDVVSGDRSPASEYTALVRTSIDRVRGWYAIASYLITQIQYSGKNPENNSTVSYNALGGTGRLGAGWFSPDTPWGFLGVVDMSGFTFNGKTSSFASMEMNGVYRMDVGRRGELRLQGGVFYKELPETIGDPFTRTSSDSTISAAGPHLGAEYWYSLTPKLGIQANIHFYTGLFKISTPNGRPLSPSLSTQVGFLGSYRFTPTFTGLVGYARREDKLSYKASPSSFSDGNDSNTSDISGNYLNFFAEWSF